MVRPVELEGMELRMSAKERDRLVVIRALDADRLSVRQAAEQLGLSERQVYRSLQRFRAQGDAGLVHRSRGRPSHRCLPAAIAQPAREALRDEDYADFGPTFAAQKLHERQGIKLSQETVPRLLLSFVRISAVALPVQRAPRPGAVHVCAGVNAVRTDLHERLAIGAPLPGREFFNAHGNMGQKWYNAE